MNKHKRKKIILIGVILQAILWLGVIFAGSLFFLFKFNSNFSLTALTIFYTLLVLFGSFIVPAWTSLMKDIVINKRGEYFGNRNRIIGIFSIVSSLIAGFILDFFEVNILFIGFFILFFTAFIFRTISGILFLAHYESKLKIKKESYFSFLDFLKKGNKSNFLKFTIFISLFIFSTYIAAPFFAVYMLEDLGFSYTKWIMIGMVGSLSSLFFMPLIGKFADKYGSIKILKITGVFIPFFPFFWVLTYFFNPNSYKLVIFLFTLEFFAGILWAGFNLAYNNFIYDTVTREKTALCIAYFNVLHGLGIFIGSMLGGLILSFDFKFFIFSPILFVILLSGVMRALSYFIMMPKIKEVREVEEFSLRTNLKTKLKENLRVFNSH